MVIYLDSIYFEIFNLEKLKKKINASCFMFHFAKMVICLKEYNIIFFWNYDIVLLFTFREKIMKIVKLFPRRPTVLYSNHTTERKVKPLIRVTIAKYMFNSEVSVVAKNKNGIEIFLSKKTAGVETVQKIIIWATVSTNVFFSVPV